MSASSMRSPRPPSVASYQSSSPRLPSPLNSSPNSLSPPLPTGHTPRNSPVGEMSDTLSPLRERLDSGLSSPRSPPSIFRPRTSSFSRSGASPERTSVGGSIPSQTHRAYARHPSPNNSPFAQGIPFPSSPLSSSPLVGPSQSPISHSPRPLSPASSRPGQCSPTTIHSPRFQTQTNSLYSPTHAAQPYFHLPQSSTVQIIPSSSSRFPRAQSLIQQSFGNQYAAQVHPDDPRNRRASLGVESRFHMSSPGSPVPVGPSFSRSTAAVVNGDSTPVNEAPIRWWGGRRGWVDDWDNVMQQSRAPYDPCTAHFYSPCEPNGAIRMESAQSGCGNSLSFREPFGRSRNGPGAFLDEEIRASFDGVGDVSTRFASPSTLGYEMEGIPVSRAIPVPMVPGIPRSGWNDGLGYDEVDVGGPPVEGAFAMEKPLHNVARRHSCHFGNASGFTSDGAASLHGQGLHGSEHVGERGRRFSNASMRSSTSYVSCTSGPSQSQSQSLLISTSQSHTSTCPCLRCMGIGIEENEREQRRSRTFWGRRNSGSTMKRQSKDLSGAIDGHDEDAGQRYRSSHLARKGEKGGNCQGECMDDVEAVVRPATDSKPSVTHTHVKDTGKHGSIFMRVVSKRENPSGEQARQVGYSSAEKWVSLAITSILPAATIAKLSPVGEALVKTAESVRYVSHELAPVIKDTLSASASLLALAPLPGLEEAAKALLTVWDACQKVDTNRLSCLRLAERCATLLYSVLCDIKETGLQGTLDEPVERLCGALAQIRTFLNTQLHRPFLKRYVRREEIARELQACNDAITDAASRFGMSVQIRTYQQVWSAATESRRFVQETQALLSLDHQIIQRQFEIMLQQETRREDVTISSGNALGLTMDGPPMSADGQVHMDPCKGDNPLPPPYGPPVHPASTTARLVSTMDTLAPNGSGLNAQTSSMPPLGGSYGVADSTVPLPPTPMPTKTKFIAEESKTRTLTTTTKTETVIAHTPSPMRALKDVHQAQDSMDAAEDEADLQGTLAGALDAQNDVEIVRCLQVARGEIPEAAETLRRMLVVEEKRVGSNEPTQLERGDLDRKFMQSGIDAMTRLASVGEKQPRSEETVELRNGAVGASELPNWTITRYEVIRTRKIGMGFLSDVYLGHWKKLTVVIKVLAHSVSREAFVRLMELWNSLDHPNVLPLYGASSAMGEKPWFFVSKFCSGDNLSASLKQARSVGAMVVGDNATMRVDLLRFMHEIAKGMAYLHGCGVLHGDLRAANVLIDENGHCILSDFAQCEIKSEAHQSSRQPEQHLIRWRAPEMLTGDDQPTNAADVYAFAMCCIEILGMGDLPWATLDDRAIHELVMDRDERPPIPVLAGYGNAANAVANLVQSCWIREPNLRPSFSNIVESLEEIWTIHGHGKPQICLPSPSGINTGLASMTSTESSAADELYETASESTRTEVEEETVDGMIDVSLASPVPTVGNGRSVLHVKANNHTENDKISTQVNSVISELQYKVTPTPSPTNNFNVDAKNEENYRRIVGSNHAFHSSLTLPLWSPSRVEPGAVGYLSKPKGEFMTLFNAIQPLQSDHERFRQLPSVYGYGKFEVQKREEGKRSVAQRGLDAISIFLTFRTRGDQSHPERVARQYAFPLVQGKPSAHLCVEKTVHRYMDHLEAPMMWFKQHVSLILDVCAVHHTIRREDLILVVGTLDAPDWAVFVSDDHVDGRAQFNVFAGREKDEPWGMYIVEPAIKNTETGRCVDVGQATFASKVSCVTGHDVAGDTVMLAGLRFEQGMQVPTLIHH